MRRFQAPAIRTWRRSATFVVCVVCVSLAVSSCLVSFEDYPQADPDAGSAATAGSSAGGGGGSGGVDADSSTDAGGVGGGGVGGVGGAGAGGLAGFGGFAGVDAGDASDAGGAGHAGSGGGNCTVEKFTPDADTQICDAQCGSIVYGTSGVLNIGSCVGLFRFPLSPNAQGAIQSGGSNVTLALRLKRAETHAACSGTCPAAAGTMLARALRVDWVEGVLGQAYSGADWCRRTSGNPGEPWGAKGATLQAVDVFDESGSAAVLGSFSQQSEIAIPLAVSSHQTTISGGLLAVRLESNGIFVAEARELGAPTLEVTTCMP